MVKMEGKTLKVLAILVIAVVVTAVIAVLLMGGAGTSPSSDDDQTVSNQIDAMAMIGGLGWEGLEGVTIADDGTVYAVGWTNYQSNITTDGAFDRSCEGNSELIVAKFSEDLNLIACTYLGGVGKEMGNAIIVGPDGDVFVAGGTTSTDFPVTDGSADSIGPDGLGVQWTNFVCRMSPDLSSIVSCTYIGGSIDDPRCQMALSASGDLIVGGTVEGIAMNATEGAFCEDRPGDNDIYVAVLSSDLGTIESLTYLGGSETDRLYDMVIGPDGDIFLACGTLIASSTLEVPFPTTDGAYMTNDVLAGYGGNFDGAVVRLSADLSELRASTLFGSDDIDIVIGIAMHPDGDVVIVGETNGNLVTTEGAYQTSRTASLQGFVAKLDANLTEVRECTYIGTGNSYVDSVVCDSDGRIYLHGTTGSFPTTPGAIRETYGGWNGDMFLAQMSSDLSFLRSSTYIGGNYDEGDGYGLALASEGTVYLVGWTTSTNFPAENIGNASADYADGFVLKITFG